MTDQNLQNREGQSVPDVTFKIRRNNEWATVTSDDLFKGKNVIVFSLPGALRRPVRRRTSALQRARPAFQDKGNDSIVWSPSTIRL